MRCVFYKITRKVSRANAWLDVIISSVTFVIFFLLVICAATFFDI